MKKQRKKLKPILEFRIAGSILICICEWEKKMISHFLPKFPSLPN